MFQNVAEAFTWKEGMHSYVGDWFFYRFGVGNSCKIGYNCFGIFRLIVGFLCFVLFAKKCCAVYGTTAGGGGAAFFYFLLVFPKNESRNSPIVFLCRYFVFEFTVYKYR
jgi:hypothetical protein